MGYSPWSCTESDMTLYTCPYTVWASLGTRMVKNLPAIQETWDGSLGQEDPLKKGTAIHSSILAWKIPWTEELDRLPSMGSQRVPHDRVTNILHCIFTMI